MIVQIYDHEDDTIYDDVVAVVRDSDGWLRLCRDGKPDQNIDTEVTVVVTG